MSRDLLATLLLGIFAFSLTPRLNLVPRFASTRTSRAAGTFGYLAPEVVNGGGATEASPDMSTSSASSIF